MGRRAGVRPVVVCMQVLVGDYVHVVSNAVNIMVLVIQCHWPTSDKDFNSLAYQI